MSTKDTTPMGSDAKTSSAAAAAEKKDTTVPTFTEKEDRVMKIAWTCLKSGPPDVDIAKLTKAAGFNTTKTAANTWAVIKKKLLSMGGDGGEGGEAQDAPKTPKAKATPKKRGKKADADGEDDAEAGAGAEDGSPKRKQRKTPVKKGKKAEQAADEDAAAIKGEDTDEAA
ncbi:hypothetical protein KC327_g18040 [Hortaea werneckii]|uniref:Myb-like domain-containing protein n=1 Tax=Hortaea werneckii EXF-2000 TaxID=1157616 RepID=A0A1Z5TEL0_HORWE|nr:hypothetical protein KC358_g12387 [Hortaea werneckii]OTA34462.1 hypothetical protein BTJ68_04081 [Hortaea werneckii EXF-2000]KAI6811002.1 hypothetical protein KC350_g12363 [Hortaea werneckii]KAI6912213.1 hypothetical protein KC348_g12745 [Hortaea werneckii]KAI6927291.1 hypothetical protein KC341_g12226 [Hortaea werneckii]